MIRALHDISIGGFHFTRGDVIPAEAQELLPRRRLEQLRTSGRVEVITSEHELAQTVAELAERVAALEAANKPTAKRKAA